MFQGFLGVVCRNARIVQARELGRIGRILKDKCRRRLREEGHEKTGCRMKKQRVAKIGNFAVNSSKE